MSKTYISVPPPSPEPKVYIALLTQTGMDAPTATVLQNTLGGTVVWSRLSAGTYAMTLAGAFGNTGNTYQYTGFNANSGNIYGVIHTDNSPNENSLNSYAAADLTTAADDVLTNFLLTVTV